MGQIPECGTGETDILIDESKLLDVPSTEFEEDIDIDKWNDLDYCDENVNMEFDETALESVPIGGFVKTEAVNVTDDDDNSVGGGTNPN